MNLYKKEINRRIADLQSLMKKQAITIYLVPTSDYHQSEYVGDHFKARQFLSGFTGSTGTLLVTQTEAFLWADGRYFIQAEEQLADTTIELCKMGEPGIPTIPQYIEETLKSGETLAVDGRVISISEGTVYKKIAKERNATFCYDVDFITKLWMDRPALPKSPAFMLDDKLTGQSVESKLSAIRQEMALHNANTHIVASLDDICWIFNLRGDDIRYSPLILSYAIIYANRVDLFTDQDKLNSSILDTFTQNGITVHPYNAIYTAVANLNNEHVVLLDYNKLNYALFCNLTKDIQKINLPNPSSLMKAKKNVTEIANARIAHLKDGIAVTKFLYWLKHTIGTEPLTEISVSNKLESLRREQPHFISPSFAPISAYQDHGAIVHYKATEESDKELHPIGFLLLDTGAHFLEGSTDITRTIPLGPITDEMKLHFTTVLKGMLRLMNASFLYGCCGCSLDILARQPLWDLELNYNHGTGHGVGNLLGVHEGPAAIAWQNRPSTTVTLEEGMITSDEPGLYIEGAYGIRIENELLVQKGTQNQYGQFMYFEPLTLAPIDLDAIDANLLTEKEKVWLNDYHQTVYQKLSPHLTSKEQIWLARQTTPIS